MMRSLSLFFLPFLHLIFIILPKKGIDIQLASISEGVLPSGWYWYLWLNSHKILQSSIKSLINRSHTLFIMSKKETKMPVVEKKPVAATTTAKVQTKKVLEKTEPKKGVTQTTTTPVTASKTPASKTSTTTPPAPKVETVKYSAAIPLFGTSAAKTPVVTAKPTPAAQKIPGTKAASGNVTARDSVKAKPATTSLKDKPAVEAQKGSEAEGKQSEQKRQVKSSRQQQEVSEFTTNSQELSSNKRQQAKQEDIEKIEAEKQQEENTQIENHQEESSQKIEENQLNAQIQVKSQEMGEKVDIQGSNDLENLKTNEGKQQEQAENGLDMESPSRLSDQMNFEGDFQFDERGPRTSMSSQEDDLIQMKVVEIDAKMQLEKQEQQKRRIEEQEAEKKRREAEEEAERLRIQKEAEVEAERLRLYKESQRIRIEAEQEAQRLRLKKEAEEVQRQKIIAEQEEQKIRLQKQAEQQAQRLKANILPQTQSSNLSGAQIQPQLHNLQIQKQQQPNNESQIYQILPPTLNNLSINPPITSTSSYSSDFTEHFATIQPQTFITIESSPLNTHNIIDIDAGNTVQVNINASKRQKNEQLTKSFVQRHIQEDKAAEEASREVRKKEEEEFNRKRQQQERQKKQKELRQAEEFNRKKKEELEKQAASALEEKLKARQAQKVQVSIQSTKQSIPSIAAPSKVTGKLQEKSDGDLDSSVSYLKQKPRKGSKKSEKVTKSNKNAQQQEPASTDRPLMTQASLKETQITQKPEGEEGEKSGCCQLI